MYLSSCLNVKSQRVKLSTYSSVNKCPLHRKRYKMTTDSPSCSTAVTIWQEHFTPEHESETTTSSSFLSKAAATSINIPSYPDISSLSDSDIQKHRWHDETIDRHLERCSQLSLSCKVYYLIHFFFHFKEGKGIKGNCSYAHVATKMNSKSVDREDFKSEGQKWKKNNIFLHDVWLSILPPTSFFLIKTKENKKAL